MPSRNPKNWRNKLKYDNVELHGVWDIVEDEGVDGFGMCRLPLGIMDDINPGARGMSRMGAGCEIRGLLPEGGSARVVLECIDDNVTPPVATVFYGCFCDQTVLLGPEPVEITIAAPNNIDTMIEISRDRNLAFDPRLVRIRLPSIHTTRILSIEGDLSYPTPGSIPQTTMLSYGSSITHGASAIPPGGTYASQCARRLGCDLINLGLGGAAQMDRAIADHIASRSDWNFATFEMGINVRMWPLETFLDAVRTFVTTVADAHPETYIFCIDLFTNNSDFDNGPTFGVGFREVVKEIAGSFASGKVIHIDGRTLLTDPTGLRTDLVHPADDGMQEMGAKLAMAISEHYTPNR